MSPVCTMGVPGPPAPRTGAGTGAGRHGTLTRERKRCPQPTPPRGGLMGKRKPAKHRKATGADRSATPRESPHRRPVFPEVRLQRRCPRPLPLVSCSLAPGPSILVNCYPETPQLQNALIYSALHSRSLPPPQALGAPGDLTLQPVSACSFCFPGLRLCLAGLLSPWLHSTSAFHSPRVSAPPNLMMTPDRWV